jgi:hypothetical protein
MKSVIYNQDTNEVVAIINNENGEIFCLNEYYLKSYDDSAEPCFTEFDNDDKLYLRESNFIMHTDYLNTDGNEYYEEEEDYES